MISYLREAVNSEYFYMCLGGMHMQYSARYTRPIDSIKTLNISILGHRIVYSASVAWETVLDIYVAFRGIT